MAGFKKSAKHGKGHHAEPRPAAKLSKQKAAVAGSYRLRDYGDLDEIEKAYVDGLTGMIKAESQKNGGLVDYLAKAWHANQIHGDHLDPYTEPLDRLTKEPGTSASAVFVKTPETPDPMRTAIRRAVEDNIEKIAIWMLYGKSSDLELNFVERPERPLDTKIGTGVARIPRGKSGKYNFVERDCYDAKIVLIKTSEGASGYSVWGPAPTLRLKTAHPDAAAPSGKKTGRDLVPTLIDLKAYKACKDAAQKREWLVAAGCPDPDRILESSPTQARNPLQGRPVDPARFKKDPTASCLASAKTIAETSKDKNDYTYC